MRNFTKLLVLGFVTAILAGCGARTLNTEKLVRLAGGGVVTQGGTTGGNPSSSATTVVGIAPVKLPPGKLGGLGLSLTVCVEKLRFIPDSGNIQEVKLNDLGMIDLLAPPATLASIKLPAGTYRRVVFEIDDECDQDYSARLSNALGSYTADVEVDLVFEGVFQVGQDASEILLDIRPLVAPLTAVNTIGELEQVFKSFNGGFRTGTNRKLTN